MPEPLRVLLVASEVAPYAKTGGLADVMGALPAALRRRGIDVRVLMPRYGWISRQGLQQQVAPLGVPVSPVERWCAVLEGRRGEVPIYFLEHDVLYDRPDLYGPGGGAYADNCLRFALLSRGALQLCHHLGWWPDIIHANDWQAALSAVYLNTVTAGTPLAATASVLTIHNLAYQGWFYLEDMQSIGLDPRQASPLGLEWAGYLNLLKAGIHHATLVTTVSPSYAREIQTPWFGEGLDPVLRSRRSDLFGVLNGIDTALWDPAADPHLPRNYSADDLSGKAYCKAVLQQEAGLAPRPDVALVGMVTRLSPQKGVDVVAACLDRLLDLDIQLVLLGTGDAAAEEFFRAAAARRPDRFRAFISFDERLAHLVEAGSDLYLMPSRWEPCGLNQMYSFRYGSLPIVRSTGGLQDTGTNLDTFSGEGDCFKFYDLTADALVGVVGWAASTYREQKTLFYSMVRRAMAEDFSWDRAAASYEYFYRLASVRRRGLLGSQASPGWGGAERRSRPRAEGGSR
jgi:starch synthase